MAYITIFRYYGSLDQLLMEVLDKDLVELPDQLRRWQSNSSFESIRQGNNNFSKVRYSAQQDSLAESLKYEIAAIFSASAIVG